MKKAIILLSLLTTLLLLFLLSNNAYAAGDIKVLSSLTHEKTVGSGEQYDGVISIKSIGKEAGNVKIYQTDYIYTSDGKNYYGTPGSTPCSNAGWITLSTNYLTIPANDTATVNYSVKIPKSPNLKGTYWSMIMVEPAGNSMGELAPQRDRVVMGLQTKIRFGIQVITNIGETGIRKIEFLDKKVVIDNGKVFLQLDIKNNGERTLSPSVSAQIYNKEGKLLGNFSSDKVRILPSCSVRHKIMLTNIPNGKYKALVIVDNGDQYVFGANYELGITQ